MPWGAEVRIEAKISSEMPLPMPRFVISSPEPHQERRAGGQRDDDQHEPARVAGQRALLVEEVRVPGACAAARTTVR